MENMENKQIKLALPQKKQPFKSITHQDIHSVKETLDQLQSWTKLLASLNDFFSCQTIPLNKKKITRDYHANSQVFSVFFTDFLKQTTILEEQLNTLKSAKKIND